MTLTAAALHERFRLGAPTFLVDVRASSEFAAWKIEGPTPADAINIPYTRLLADADEDRLAEAAAAKIASRYRDSIPTDRLVVAVCAKGSTSAFVAEGLRSLGFDAVNLEGGMAAWGDLYDAAAVGDFATAAVWQVSRPARGCLSWVIVSDGDAIVIDPLRHVAPYTNLLDRQGARLKAVIDTHAHADHVSGGRALAARTGATYLLHPFDAVHPMDMLPATFAFEPLRADAPIGFGRSSLRPLHVPGHTLGSTAFVLDERYLFCGDTLFLDAVARPDLGGKAEAWTPLHHESLRRLLGLDPELVVCPGHFSRGAEADGRGIFAARLGDLPARNEGARQALGNEATFSAYIRASLPEFPPQYVEIKRVNLGLSQPDDTRAAELELGRNVCALAHP